MSQATQRAKISPYLNLITLGISFVLFLLYVRCFINLGDDTSGFSLLGLLMLVQLTPAILVLTRKEFNFIVFVMLNHFVVYSVAKYNLLMNIDKSLKVPEIALNAIREMVFCSVLIIAAYYIVRTLLLRENFKTKNFHFLEVSPRMYTWLGIYAFTQPFIAREIPYSFYVIHLLTSYAALCLIFCAKTKYPLLERWMKAVLFASSFYSYLEYGSLASLGSVASLFFMISFMQWRSANFLLLGILTLSGVALQSVKAEYRIISRNNSLNKVEEAEVLGDLLVWKFSGGKSELLNSFKTEYFSLDSNDTEDEDGDEAGPDVEGSLSRGFARIGDDSLERVLAYTPSRVPFWNGETYTHIPYIFIPRFMWPGKPSRDLWNKFGRMYGFLSSDDYETSVGFNFLSEGYMNFGYFGLYSVALLFGSMVALFEVISFYYLGNFSYFTFICFLLPFVNYGLDLASIINGMVLVLTVMMLIRYRLVPMIQRDVYV